MFALMPWRKARAEEFPVAELGREFGALCNRLFAGWPNLPEEFLHERLWNTEIEETEKEILVRMEAPGFEAEEFKVEILGNRLTVKAENAVEAKEPAAAKEAHELEKRTRCFERIMTLPEGMVPEMMTAVYRNGVLELHLPRAENVLPRRVPVNG